MKIRLKVFGTIRRAIGQSVVSLEATPAANVHDIITAAIKKFGLELENILLNNNGAISGNLIVMLNGHDIDLLDGLDTSVRQGDEIAILPHVQGGV